MTRTIKRVLIANRGEIALRIIRTLRERGIESVCVYSDADRESRHIGEADFALHLPGKTTAETYLSIPALLKATQVSGADAVHPGYGFLSENPEFAERISKETQAVYLGPKAETVALMGDKVAARQHMLAHEIPVVPGISQPLKSAQEIIDFAKTVGYPVIIKAAFGGGGKGMRIVRSDETAEEEFQACKREARTAFQNDVVFCEKYLEHPRHIEFQVLRDQLGNCVHLFERDCSIQRKHQKLFEEAPSSFLDEKTRLRMGDIAVKVASSVDYLGVGTVEFICEKRDGQIHAFFMEMNTRIQVEHPVTEMITGIDLVYEQILVAEGRPISFQQSDLQIFGHAVEARINAEDPERGFLPKVGRIEHLRWPLGGSIRVESHLYKGYRVPKEYDSMLAKLLAWGRTREEAFLRLKRALEEFELAGIPTTAAFHRALLENEAFKSGEFTTAFLIEEADNLQKAYSGRRDLDEHESQVLRATAAALLQERESQPQILNTKEEAHQERRLARWNI